jgi:thiol-disulfide isomerase/thioredoxin
LTWRRCLHWFAVSGTALILSLPLIAAASASHAPAAGEAAPLFLGYGMDGKKVSLDAYAGKVVVISFWATWCPPCRAELPILENIQKAGKGSIQVVAINTESRDVFRRAVKILTTFTLQFTNDESRTGFNAYGVKALPHLVVIGKDSRIISVREGYGPGELKEVAAELQAALRVGTDVAADPTTETR